VQGKLSGLEAMAIQVLSSDPNWQKFKDYIDRLNDIETVYCRTQEKDHRFHQGKGDVLAEIVRIEEKAKNILNGTEGE
jgi:hypothetical protein